MTTMIVTQWKTRAIALVAVSVLVGGLALRNQVVALEKPKVEVGGKAIANVSGTVMLKGKPLAAGKITLYAADGQFVGAKIKDGKYKIDVVPVGTRTVSIEGEGVTAKYSGETTSGLTLEVGKGGAECNLELQ